MKRMILSTVIAIIVITFSSCNDGYENNMSFADASQGGGDTYSDFSSDDIGQASLSDVSSPDENYPKDIPFEAQYIRTNGYCSDEEYPKTLFIKSVDELKGYYDANKDKYSFDSANPVSSQKKSFTNAIKKYDEKFFDEHTLIFVVLEEGSGSILHEVTSVELGIDQDGGAQYFILPHIRRNVPEIGTEDMAEWHIIIEIDSCYVPKNCDLLQASVS